MKICLVSNLFEPWNLGGAEKHVAALALELAKAHQVIVITTTGPKPRAENQSSSNPRIIEIKPNNIMSRYEKVANSSSNGAAKTLLWHLLELWDLSSYKQMKKILHHEKPDIVHSHNIRGLSISCFGAIKQNKIPHIHTLHDYELISPWSALYRTHKPISKFHFFDRLFVGYMRKMSSSVDSVISPSKFVMDFFSKMGFFKNSKKFVVPHGTISCSANPKKNFGKEFLFIGRITEEKGVQVAIEAFKKIKDGNVKLNIVGNGPYLDKLKQIAWGDKRIIFHGFVGNSSSLEEVFNRSSYAVVPSLWYENFPLVINEVRARGLPVLASKIGGIPELVKDGHDGFFFEAGNADSLYSLLENLTKDTDMLPKLSENAIEMSKRFSIEEQTKTILNIYTDAMQQRMHPQ
jgi:glycosyltransferase involved in cell wall biosynthesis